MSYYQLKNVTRVICIPGIKMIRQMKEGESNMENCFVMQPFDGDTFDKRYKDIFSPAIKDAGLEPYRVDQDPKVSIPIQDIENGIRDSVICFAEITLDNPNVWFELGFAIASGKEVLLVCSDERTTKFPFDIQHRSVIKYSTTSSSDFENLKLSITKRIKAYLEKAATLNNVSEITKLTKFEGLDSHEVVALAAIAQNLDYPEDNTTAYMIKKDMEASGYTKVAATIAIKNLVIKGLILMAKEFDEHGDEYTGYSFSESGWEWVLKNKDRFVLKQEPPSLPPEDNIPF